MRIAIGAAVMVAAGVLCAAQTPQPSARSIPAGTMFNVVLQTPLNSATIKVEQRINTGSLEDWKIGGQVVVPIGSTIRGFVSSLASSTRKVQDAQAKGMGQLTLSFDELVLGDRKIKLTASVNAVLDPRRQPDNTRRSSTANVVGGSGQLGLPPYTDVVVTGGTILPVGIGDVKLPPGLVLRIRLDQVLEFPAVSNSPITR